jgi:hypothetical protein
MASEPSLWQRELRRRQRIIILALRVGRQWRLASIGLPGQRRIGCFLESLLSRRNPRPANHRQLQFESRIGCARWNCGRSPASMARLSLRALRLWGAAQAGASRSATAPDSVLSVRLSGLLPRAPAAMPLYRYTPAGREPRLAIAADRRPELRNPGPARMQV